MSTGSQENSEIAIKYCLPVKEYGLIEDRIVVQNLSCSGQNAEVLLRLYVDRGSLKCHLQPPMQYLQGSNFKIVGVPPNTNLSSNHPLKFSSQPIRGNLTQGIEDTLALQGFSPRSIYLCPAADSEVKNFQGRPTFNVDKVVGLSVDNHQINVGIVYVSFDPNGIKVESHGPTDKELMSSAEFLTLNRSFRSSLLLTNLSDEALTLQPVSTLSLQVFVDNQHVSQMSEILVPRADFEYRQTTFSTTSDIVTQSLKQMPGSSSGWSACGNKFNILPGNETRLLLACDGILQPLSSVDVSQLEKGQLRAFEGRLAFCKTNITEINEDIKCEITAVQEEWDLSQFQELLTITGSMCVSFGEVETKFINLGKVGDANGWQDIEFDVEIYNASDAELVIQISDAPSVFSFSFHGLEVVASENGFSSCRIPARESNSVQAVLHTSKLEHNMEAKTWSWELCFKNLKNAKNSMEVTVVAEMTVRNLRFLGLTESSLILPPLTVPSQRNAQHSSRRFSVSFKCNFY